MGGRLNKALMDVNLIDFNLSEYTYRKSNLILAQEYIRRAALFMKYISKDCKFPFFRAADFLEKPNFIDINSVCPKLSLLDIRSEKNVCKYYIEWAFLADEGEELALRFEDIYDPLILLFKRGVNLMIHHGFLEIGKGNSIDLRKGIQIYASETFLDISDYKLEQYD
jgi:hypothetical protein